MSNTKQKLQEEQAAYIKKLLCCLMDDPMTEDYHKNYKNTEGYLWELMEKEGSILHGLVVAMEHHLEK
jgi:hypothetical protein